MTCVGEKLGLAAIVSCDTATRRAHGTPVTKKTTHACHAPLNSQPQQHLTTLHVNSRQSKLCQQEGKAVVTRSKISAIMDACCFLDAESLGFSLSMYRLCIFGCLGAVFSAAINSTAPVRPRSFRPRSFDRKAFLFFSALTV